MKDIYIATDKPARYVGTHPHITGKQGVYHWSQKQNSYVFRPDAKSDEGKTDWYRIHRENLLDMPRESSD